MNFLLVKITVTVIHFCQQKKLMISLFRLKSTMYLLKTLLLETKYVRNILKSKESPRMTFESR